MNDPNFKDNPHKIFHRELEITKTNESNRIPSQVDTYFYSSI